MATKPIVLFTVERIFRSTTGNISASKIIVTRKSRYSCSRQARLMSMTQKREFQVVSFDATGKRTILKHFYRGEEVPV